MAKFTTRVELHGAKDDGYQTLHSEMKDRGFTRIIEGSDGTVYKLPTAEYDYQGPVTRKDVLAKARAAAKATGRSYWILVTESVGRTWNLDED
jgi:hypothetical protein